MRVVIVTAGSRGDVAPFTGLGQRLQQDGHQVAVAAHQPFAGLVRECGLGYRPLPGDPVALVRARTQVSSPQATQALTEAFLDELGVGVLAAVADAEAVLTAFGAAPLSQLAGEALGIPVIGTYLAPAVPTGEFPLPGSRPARPGRQGNLKAGRALLSQAAAWYAPVLARLRTELGLPGPGSGAGPGPGHDWPICHGFSPVVVPRPRDWPSGADIAGYWWPARLRDWQPPSELVSFLQAGPPPVFIGFGSMTPADGEQLGGLIAAAAARAGMRAVVQAGWAGLTAPRQSDQADLLAVGDMPHEWLFPQMAAVVHHAGAGTTGACLRAGVPAVAIPVLADQPFWADQLHRLGVAPPPVPFAALTAETLASAIAAAVTDPAYRQRAVRIAGLIAAEDGASKVLALVRGLVR
jgi:sterol 3beta-glucosyltransferase